MLENTTVNNDQNALLRHGEITEEDLLHRAKGVMLEELSTSPDPNRKLVKEPNADRETMVAFYTARDPGKLPLIDKILERFKGKEPTMYEFITQQYDVSRTSYYRDSLIKYYERHNPSRICATDVILDLYEGQEEQLFLLLVNKYNPRSPIAVWCRYFQPGSHTPYFHNKITGVVQWQIPETGYVVDHERKVLMPIRNIYGEQISLEQVGNEQSAVQRKTNLPPPPPPQDDFVPNYVVNLQPKVPGSTNLSPSHLPHGSRRSGSPDIIAQEVGGSSPVRMPPVPRLQMSGVLDSVFREPSMTKEISSFQSQQPATRFGSQNMSYGLGSIGSGNPTPVFAPTYSNPAVEVIARPTAVSQPTTTQPFQPLPGNQMVEYEPCVCEECHQVCNGFEDLANHKETAQHGSWYRCTTGDCKFSFPSQISLVYHIMTKHPQASPRHFV